MPAPNTELVIIDSEAEHWSKCSFFAERADEILVSTYGVYASILADGRIPATWGAKYHNPAYEFLNQCRGRNTTILVGVADYFTCHDDKSDCEHCVAKHQKTSVRHMKHVEHWKEFTWKFVRENHFKLVAFRSGDNWIAIIGGRNFSGSDWFDCSYMVSGSAAKSMVSVFQQTWEACEPADLSIPTVSESA